MIRRCRSFWHATRRWRSAIRRYHPPEGGSEPNLLFRGAQGGGVSDPVGRCWATWCGNILVVIMQHSNLIRNYVYRGKTLPVQEDRTSPASSVLPPASANLLRFCIRLQHGRPDSHWTSWRACCVRSRTSWSFQSSRWTGQHRPDHRRFRTGRPRSALYSDPSSGLFWKQRKFILNSTIEHILFSCSFADAFLPAIR